MTAPNVAQDDAHVGVQAQTIHGGVTYYQLTSDVSPEDTFRCGVRFLDAKMPARARELVEDAVTHGYDTDEARFHLVLAVLSGRTRQQLGDQDFAQLSDIYRRHSSRDEGNEWTAGLEAVRRLLRSVHDTENSSIAEEGAVDDDVVAKELDALAPFQRDKILGHLEALLEGPKHDGRWRRSVDRAQEGQTAHDRADRAWKFFHAEPAPPPPRRVEPASPAIADWVRTILGTVAFGVGAGFLAGVVLSRGEAGPILACVAGVLGVVGLTIGGADRHFRRERRRAKDAEVDPARARHSTTPAGGFARKVDRAFDHYFARYVPRHADRATWLAETAGVRSHLRDEVVELYREQRTDAEAVMWLVRYLVSEVRKQWKRGTATAYRAQLRPPVRTTLLWWSGTAGRADDRCLAASPWTAAGELVGWILVN